MFPFRKAGCPLQGASTGPSVWEETLLWGDDKGVGGIFVQKRCSEIHEHVSMLKSQDEPSSVTSCLRTLQAVDERSFLGHKI